MPAEDTLHLRYSFYLQDGQKLQFLMELSVPGLDLATEERSSYPDWTRLDSNKCPHCPLSSDQHPRCPLAANLVDVVETFESGVASDEAEIIIRTDHRSYGRKGPLAQGISSMIGVIMVTSGCPVMDKLRPMAFTHLPFASKQETMFRSLSMYLLAQFFVSRKGGKPDWLLQDFVKIYDDINIVNEHVSKRLETVCKRDANLNALTKLDCFASIAAISVESDSLEDIENLFQAYYRKQQPGGGNSSGNGASGKKATVFDPLADDDDGDDLVTLDE